MFLIIFLFPIVLGQRNKTVQTLIMQNKYEHYHYDLLSQYSDYQNAEFEVLKIEPLNEYSKEKEKPNFSISELSQPINFISFQKKYQNSQQYNLKKHPITLLLFNTDLVIISFVKNDQNTMLIQDHQEYNLVDFASNIKMCTTIYGLFDDLKVNIDCTTLDDDFINLNVELILDEIYTLQNIICQQSIYIFENLNSEGQEVNEEWKNCKKKEVKYFNSKGTIHRIFYCLYHNLYHIQDQLIMIEDQVIESDDITIIQVNVLDKSQFSVCNNDVLIEKFLIKQLIVNSINFYQDFTLFEQQNKWILSLLLVDRYGICKCGNLIDSQIECDFLELQEGQYTNLYSTSYLDEISYIYVASEILLYKINYYFSFQTDQDKIEGYYYIKQDGYELSKMHVFYDYLIVLMQSVSSNNYQSYLDQKILFFQKKYNIQQYVPNYIINSTSRYQILRVNFDEFPGNYFLQYDLEEKNLYLYQLQYKHLVFQYNNSIDEKNYLLFGITLQINSSNIIEEDYFKLLISSYEDGSFLTIKENAQSSLTFKSEQFHFQLNENLLGPLLNYHEIEWNLKKDSASIIEYIREIKFRQSKNIFQKVFTGLFVYNEVNVYFTITGLIETEDEGILMAQQQYKYDKVEFTEDGKLKTFKFKLKNIDFVSTHIFTSIIGDKNENNFILCFNHQFGTCSKLGGDFENVLDQYDYVFLSELRAKNDTLFAISKNRNRIDIYSFDYDIWGKDALKLIKVGVIDEQNIKELQHAKIFDSLFYIVDDKLSFLLLSDGTILSFTTQYSISDNAVNIKIVNKIQEQGCFPNSRNSSRIFIQFHDNKRVLVYLCVESADIQIFKEYDLQNPYNPIFIRRYPLYNYTINVKLKPFNDQKVIYIPIENKGYLAYSPFFVSPNVLLHLIPIIKDSLTSAIPVIVNNFDTNEWNIFSMAFFHDQLGGNLFYLNSNPTYYGIMNANENNNEKMIMVYQQNQDEVIFKQFNITFDYTETKINVNQSYIHIETEDHNALIKLSGLDISGAVEDIEITDLSNKNDVIVQKNDLLELKQFISNHYESLQYGRVFDILDLNQTEFLSIINQTAIENNLIFAVSQNYFLIYEKQRQTTKHINRITLLEEIKLTKLNSQLLNLKQCRLSINDINQVMLYCYKYNSGDINENLQFSRSALYFLINFNYDYLNSKIDYQISPFKIDLGSRLQIEAISPIKFKGKIFQFIKYNFENSQDQYELICGYIENDEFKGKQIIQSSTFDYNILGQLSFDVRLWNNEEYILILTLDIHELRIFLFNLNGSSYELIKVKEEKFTYLQLNQYLFKSLIMYRLETIHLAECQLDKCLVLLGIPDKFYEFSLIVSLQNSSIILKEHTFLNYFRCIHQNKLKPQIVVSQFSLQITQLVAACVKQDVEKNFFFEDKFDYLYDDLQVFVQIFHKQNVGLDSFPIRIYRFFFDITLRDTFHFILYQREPDNKLHILFENDTYFLVDYLKQNQTSFQIISNNTETTKVKGKLILSNIFKSKIVDLSILFLVQHESSKTWIFITIGVFAAIILIVLGLLKYLYQRKKNQKKKKTLTKSMIDLDDVLKEVILGETKNVSQTKLEDDESEKSF